MRMMYTGEHKEGAPRPKKEKTSCVVDQGICDRIINQIEELPEFQTASSEIQERVIVTLVGKYGGTKAQKEKIIIQNLKATTNQLKKDKAGFTFRSQYFFSLFRTDSVCELCTWTDSRSSFCYYQNGIICD